MNIYVNGLLVEKNTPTDVPAEAFISHMRELYGDDADIKIAPTAEEAKAQIDDFHAAKLRELTGNATVEERDTWERKVAAAEAYLAGTANTAQKAMIDSESVGADIPAAVLCMKIKVKSIAFSKLIGLAAGLRAQAYRAIEQAEPDQIGEVMQAITAQADQAVEQAKKEALILKACARILAEGDQTKLTDQGVPSCEVLRDILGRTVSGPERDKAVALLTG